MRATGPKLKRCAYFESSHCGFRSRATSTIMEQRPELRNRPKRPASSLAADQRTGSHIRQVERARVTRGSPPLSRQNPKRR